MKLLQKRIWPVTCGSVCICSARCRRCSTSAWLSLPHCPPCPPHTPLSVLSQLRDIPWRPCAVCAAICRLLSVAWLSFSSKAHLQIKRVRRQKRGPGGGRHIDVGNDDGDAVGNDDKRRRQSHTKLTALVVRLVADVAEQPQTRTWTWTRTTYDVVDDDQNDDKADDNHVDDVVRCACPAACRCVHSSRPTANSALGLGPRPGNGDGDVTMRPCDDTTVCGLRSAFASAERTQTSSHADNGSNSNKKV